MESITTIEEATDALRKITPEWLAGFFDGEGCVSVYVANRCTSVSVTLAQADEFLISLIETKFPSGLVYESKKYPGNWTIQWRGKNSLSFLRCIKDHVIRKKKQVALGIEFAETIGKGGYYAVISDVVLATRNRIRDQVRELNSLPSKSGGV